MNSKIKSTENYLVFIHYNILYPLVYKRMVFKLIIFMGGNCLNTTHKNSSYTYIHILVFLYAVTDGKQEEKGFATTCLILHDRCKISGQDLCKQKLKTGERTHWKTSRRKQK